MRRSTTDTHITQFPEDKVERLRKKLLKEIHWINSQELDHRVITNLVGILNYFATKYEFQLNDLILTWMKTILEVKNRCKTTELKEMFDEIIPNLTECCATIAIKVENAPFLRNFFFLWSQILSGTDNDIKRFTANNKISALINICETIFKTGHYLTQMNGLDIFLRYIGTCEEGEKKEILETIIADKFRRIRDLLCNFDNSNFDFESRDFLNTFNMIISDEEPVYSIAIKKGYINDKPIRKPMHGSDEGILWVDFNSATESVSFYCNSTTFFPNLPVHWINVEIIPNKISIERKTYELNVFSNRKDIDVFPLTPGQIFPEPDLIFKFVYDEKDFSHLQDVISCYNFQKKSCNDIFTYAENIRLYKGFKTIAIEKRFDNFCDNIDVIESSRPHLHSPKEQPKLKKFISLSQNDAQQKSTQQVQKIAIFENLPTYINKKLPKDILAITSDVSSFRKTSNDNKEFSSEEIVSTSDVSKITMPKNCSITDLKNLNLQTEGNGKNNTNSRPKMSSCGKNYEGIFNKFREIDDKNDNRKDNNANGRPKVSAYQKNDERHSEVTLNKFKEKPNLNLRMEGNIKDNSDKTEMSAYGKNYEANYQESLKKFKENLMEESRQDNTSNFSNLRLKESPDKKNDEITYQESSKNNTELNLETEIDKRNKTAKDTPKLFNNTKFNKMNRRGPFKEMTNVTVDTPKMVTRKSAKAQIITSNNKSEEITNLATGGKNTKIKKSSRIVDDSNQKTNDKKSDKTNVKTIVHDITKDVNLETEAHHSRENISQNKISNEAILTADRQADHEVSGYSEENPLQDSKSGSKRKLYTPNEEVFVGSQVSKDSQLQRRKYLQERRKTVNKNSLKLINLVKPLEFSEKDSNLKEEDNFNTGNTSISGSEVQVQQVVEEYVQNRGYVGIQYSLKSAGIGNKFTEQQQEIIKNNLNTINSILVRSANKFFKSKSTQQVDIYDVRNCVTEVPEIVKKGRRGGAKKGKMPIVNKKHTVPKYIGENTMASYSYRRAKNNNLANINKSETDNFDKLKKAPDFNTMSGKPKPVNKALVIPKIQPTAKNSENVNFEQSESSLMDIDPIQSTIVEVIDVDVSEGTIMRQENENSERSNSKQIDVDNSNNNKTVRENISIESQNRNYTSEDTNNYAITQPFIRTSHGNNQLNHTNLLQNQSKPSKSPLTNQSMAINTSFEINDNKNSYEIKDKDNNFGKVGHNHDTTQNEQENIQKLDEIHQTTSRDFLYNSGIKRTEVNYGKYTSYEHNCSYSFEKDFKQNQSRNNSFSTINFPIEDDNVSVKKTNWVINKFLDSFPKHINPNEDKQSASSHFNEEDYVDLNSYCSAKSDTCIITGDDMNGNVANYSERKVSEKSTSALQIDQRKEFVVKRRSPAPENNQVVPYKRVKTETTIDFNDDLIEDEMLSNLRRNTHQFIKNAISDTCINAGSDEIQENIFHTLSIFMDARKRHNVEAFESHKKLQTLFTQIHKENERLNLEAFAGFKQWSKMQELLSDLKNSYRAEEAKKISELDKIRRNLKEAVKNIAQQEWKAYIDNITNNVVQNIQKHSDFDLQ